MTAEYRVESALNLGIVEIWESGDYWKVMKNGDIVDDHKDGQISFEDGRATVFTDSKTKQGSLEEFLGLGKGSLGTTLGQAGFDYAGKGKWNADGKTISASAIADALKANGKDSSVPCKSCCLTGVISCSHGT